MEEKFKRSQRRFDKRNVIKRRLKDYLFGPAWFDGKRICSNAEKEKLVFDGKGFQFLRTTASPCNCWGCSGEHKYRNHRAIENRKVRKEIEEEISPLSVHGHEPKIDKLDE